MDGGVRVCYCITARWRTDNRLRDSDILFAFLSLVRGPDRPPRVSGPKPSFGRPAPLDRALRNSDERLFVSIQKREREKRREKIKGEKRKRYGTILRDNTNYTILLVHTCWRTRQWWLASVCAWWTLKCFTEVSSTALNYTRSRRHALSRYLSLPRIHWSPSLPHTFTPVVSFTSKNNTS